MQVTFEGHAYLDQHTNLDDFLAGRARPSILGFHGDLPSYTYLGPVTVVTDCRPADELVKAQIETLRDALQTVRAENQRRENAILDQISKLQALTYESA